MNLGESTTYVVTDQDAAGNPSLVSGEELAAVVTSVNADSGDHTVSVFSTDGTIFGRNVQAEQQQDAAAPAPAAPAQPEVTNTAPETSTQANTAETQDADISADVSDVSQSFAALSPEQQQQLRDAIAEYDKSNTASETPAAPASPVNTSEEGQ